MPDRLHAERQFRRSARCSVDNDQSYGKRQRAQSDQPHPALSPAIRLPSPLAQLRKTKCECYRSKHCDRQCNQCTIDAAESRSDNDCDVRRGTDSKQPPSWKIWRILAFATPEHRRMMPGPPQFWRCRDLEVSRQQAP